MNCRYPWAHGFLGGLEAYKVLSQGKHEVLGLEGAKGV